MRANQGKSVAVTILRDKKQQTLTLLVASKKKGEVSVERIENAFVRTVAFALLLEKPGPQRATKFDHDRL